MGYVIYIYRRIFLRRSMRVIRNDIEYPILVDNTSPIIREDIRDVHAIFTVRRRINLRRKKALRRSAVAATDAAGESSSRTSDVSRRNRIGITSTSADFLSGE